MKLPGRFKMQVISVIVGAAVLTGSLGLLPEVMAQDIPKAASQPEPVIDICTGSREIGNYHIEDPYLSYKPFLILAEIYTPQKLDEWKEMVQDNESLDKQFDLLKSDGVYREKDMIKHAILRGLLEKRDKDEITEEEFWQEKQKLVPEPDVITWEEDEHFSNFDVLAAVNAGDEQAITSSLNKLLEFEQFLVNKSRNVLQARKNIVNNSYISKANEYFDVHFYNKESSEKEDKITYYDEELFNLVQLYTPEKTVEWKQILDDHKKKVQAYMLRDINRNKVIEEGLATAREKLQNGEISDQAFKTELLDIVEQTFLYNYYVGSVKISRAKQAEMNDEWYSDQKWYWGDYSDVVNELEEALESDNIPKIKDSLDKLLKARKELQQYNDDYDHSFIINTILHAIN